MARNWIDILVVTIVIGFGLFILYKPLKEPIDKFFGLIKRLFSGIASRTGSAKETAEEMIINYG